MFQVYQILFLLINGRTFNSFEDSELNVIQNTLFSLPNVKNGDNVNKRAFFGLLYVYTKVLFQRFIKL